VQAGGSQGLPPASGLLERMELEFTGEVVEWRGPAPYVFVPLPPDAADLVDEVKADVVYWGVVPVRAWIGDTEFTTAMFPRDDTWFLPLKMAVRRAQRVELGDVVDVRMQVGR
jgi:hypothetical protein